MKEWVNMLLASVLEETSALSPSERMLPGDMIECVPYNIIKDVSENLHYIDREVAYKNNVPLVWVLIRGFAYSIDRCQRKGIFNGKTYKECIVQVFNELGLELNEQDFFTSFDMEKKLRNFFYTSLEEPYKLENLMDKIVEDTAWFSDREKACSIASELESVDRHYS